MRKEVKLALDGWEWGDWPERLREALAAALDDESLKLAVSQIATEILSEFFGDDEVLIRFSPDGLVIVSDDFEDGDFTIPWERIGLHGYPTRKDISDVKAEFHKMMKREEKELEEELHLQDLEGKN